MCVHIATGGGKTLTVAEFIWKHVLPDGLRVLWVTKDWTLLDQAAKTFSRRYRRGYKKIGRIGGDNKAPDIPDAPDAPIVFTTIHTWASRRRSAALRRDQFDFVIIDEVHWGEDKPMYDKLVARYEGHATFIGMTATPRKGTDFRVVGGHWCFATLVRDGHLAKPRVEPAVRTDYNWDADLGFGGRGDFTSSSLGKLARSRKRNKIIVDTYLRNRDQYGKTLIFACDIKHAEALTVMLRRAGVKVNVLHHHMSQADRKLVLEQFSTADGASRSHVDVLVNVAMMTHGVDIPDIRTIMLTRPTTSAILFSQMIGRGARRAPGKNTFYIVDFVDNLVEHGDIVCKPSDFFDAATAGNTGAKSTRPPRLERHAFETAPLVHYAGANPDLVGLEYNPKQTFGLELELTRAGFDGSQPSDWGEVARRILDAIRRCTPHVAAAPIPEYGSLRQDHRRWNVTWDSSCGWEVTSRILRDEAGLEEVTDVCAALDALLPDIDLKVNYRTGAHVHLGWEPGSARTLSNLVSLVRYYEPAIFSLVSPSRFGNEYCKPLRESASELIERTNLRTWRSESPDDDRHNALNFQGLFEGLGTLELRLHNGTIEAKKILTWMSLWMVLLDAAARGVEPPSATAPGTLPLSRGAAGDIVALARLIGCEPALQLRLHERRMHVVRRSWAETEEHSEIALELLDAWAGLRQRRG